MIERMTIWAGEQPQRSKFMQFERDAAKALAQFILDAMGSQGSWYTGMAATPGTGLEVVIAPGAAYQYGQIDPTDWAGQGVDTFEGELLGVSTTQTLSGFTAPATAGQSIDYLIECQIQVQDSATVSTPFYSSANNPPTYEQKSPSRQNVIVFQVKAGTAAATGSQVAPSMDSGWIPLYVVTVDNGESSLVSADIVAHPDAPLFSGFVHTNPNGNTPVYLSPSAQQTGFINISGAGTFGGNLTVNSPSADPQLILERNGASATTLGVGSDSETYLAVNGGSSEGGGSAFTFRFYDSGDVLIGGAVNYSGPHAGTDADPYPLSQLNVAMLGGKLASDYALASGHYIVLYAGAPTADPTNVNAAIGGYFVIGVAQGTAPIQVTSTTLCANLNSEFVGGFSAGNASGNVPVSNGTLNVNLNADLLDGHHATDFQLAGAYAVLNSENTGDFEVSGLLESYGGTASVQISVGYEASNADNLNGGGEIAFINASTAPLGLIASSVQTTGPLYVGGGSPQNAYMQDAVPSGVLRSGMCLYTVTYGGTSTPHPYPGNGTAWGKYGSAAGQIEVAVDGVLNAEFYIGYRTKITLSGNLTVWFQGLGKGAGTVYVDGAAVGTVGNQMGGFSYTFSAGTHTVDIVYASSSMGAEYYEGSYGTGHDQGGSLTVFGWLPFDASGKLSSVITQLLPG